MKKITLIIPDGYNDLLTIACIGHYRNHSVTNVATRAFDITALAETTIDLTEDIRAAAIIEQITAEDVQPVRHGYWSECYTDSHHYSGICSVCDGGAIRKVKGKPLDYCPNCGARMDLKDGDTK